MRLVENEFIRQSNEGGIQRTIRTLGFGNKSWEEVTAIISKEYARIVEENPDYEFGIIGDNLEGTLRITWKKRE